MQPQTENVKVTCVKCKGSSRLTIINNTVLYKDIMPIISARLRPDAKWGFECICGNDSRVAPEEKENLDFIVQASNEMAIKRIADGLIPKNENKFVMEPA